MLQRDVERMSPYVLQHINLQVTYQLMLPASVAQGNHRPSPGEASQKYLQWDELRVNLAQEDHLPAEVAG